MMTDKAQYAVGVGAAGGVVAPTFAYGDFLNTHGFWVLSYAEWMKTVGSIYIIFMLMSLFVKFCLHIRMNFKECDCKDPLTMSPRFKRKKFISFSSAPHDSEKDK